MSHLSRAWADRALPWIVAGLAVLFVVVLVRTAWVCDDAFITLRVVDNVVHGFGPRWNVVERVQAFTHPLWFLLLVPTYLAVMQDGWLAALLLGAVLSSCTVALLAWRVAPHRGAAAVTLAILASSRAFVDFATSGLENPLSFLLVVLGTFAATRDDLPGTTRLKLVAWCAGLAALNRLDTVLLFLPVLAWLGWREGQRASVRQILPAFAPLATWLAFAFVYYGSPWPNTALAKLASGVSSGELVVQGARYLADSLRRDPITLAAISAAVLVSLWRRRSPASALAAGIVLYLAFVLRAGGDFMSGRFLSVPLCAAVVLLARTAMPATGRRAVALAGLALALGLLADHPNVSSGSDAGVVRGRIVNRDGISDERLFWFPYTGLLNRAEDWTRPLPAMSLIGRSRGDPAHVIAHNLAIGALGYYAGPHLYVVDWVALSDPLLARLPAASNDPVYARQVRREIGADPSTQLRIGHHIRNQPSGYFRSILEGRCEIDDPEINALCVRVWRLTRGPVFSRDRLRDAVGMAVAGPLRVPRAPYRPPPWREVLEVRPADPEATLHRSDVLLSSGLGNEALSLLADGLAAAPSDYNLIVQASRALIVMRRPADALGLAERAIQMEPRAPGGYRYRAEALAALGRTDDALEDLRVAADVDPLGAPAAYYDGSLILREAGRDADALPWLDAAAARGWYVHQQARDAARTGRQGP